MSFYEFLQNDIVNAKVYTFPKYVTQLNGNKVTGSIYLEKPFLDLNIFSRSFEGYSEKEGGYVTELGPHTSSIEMLTAVDGGSNKEVFSTISGTYDYHSAYNYSYKLEYNGSPATTIRVINIPEIYTDLALLSGSLTASDKDSAGAERRLYDNGRGGVYSGSLTGTLVGHVFYSEGIVALTKPDLVDFGEASSTNFKWRMDFKGTNKVPVKIFKCRAPAGHLNASTNSSFYTTAAVGTNFPNEKEIIMTGSVYITTIGMYNDDYELVGIVKIAQPIKKQFGQGVLFRVRMDW